MDKETLRGKIYSKIDELPTLPTVVTKILSLVEDNRSGASDITEAIMKDPALTSKILKVANSAYYGFSKEVSDLNRAVALLGFNMVKSLALSMGVLRSLPNQDNSSSFSIRRLWLHSVRVATLLKEFGSTPGHNEDQEYLFITGLLHDIGMVVFDQFFSDLFQQALDDIREYEGEELYQAEEKMIGFNHGEVGAMLLARWKFPDSICDAIAFHHQIEVRDTIRSRDVAMLRISDALSHELDSDKNAVYKNPEIDKYDLELLNMDEKELEEMRTFINSMEDEINAFFSAMI